MPFWPGYLDIGILNVCWETPKTVVRLRSWHEEVLREKASIQGDDGVIGKYPKLRSARSSEQSNLARKRMSICFFFSREAVKEKILILADEEDCL